MLHAYVANDALPVVITIGNPNTGKSTLYNALSGLQQKVGNFPGVTVEYSSAGVRLTEQRVRLVDLPGTYSIAAHSPDELVAVDVLQGLEPTIGAPDAIVAVVDATNLRRNLFLVSQLMELPVAVIVALNMVDLAAKRAIEIDVPELEQALGVPVVPIVATQGEGIDRLRAVVEHAVSAHERRTFCLDPALRACAETIKRELAERGIDAATLEVERALIDREGYAEKRLLERVPDLAETLVQRRAELGGGRDVATLEARNRYQWIGEIVGRVEKRGPAPHRFSDYIDRVVNHPVAGGALFLATMAIVFQAVFAWAPPFMDAIDRLSIKTSALIVAYLPPGLFTSFLTDGVIAGVGSVLVFLPQILILFAFIIVLEDSGYMSRAAFLMDRLMRWCGLTGQSFIPMLSSFACAVPGIMGTRVIANTSDRLATIMAAPFMTCSARLPIYALLIAAFVPSERYLGGLVNLQGLVLLGFYLLGMAGGMTTAYLLKRTILKGSGATFLLEMPPYRLPDLRSMLIKLWSRIKMFLKRAGTIIFCVAMVVWFLVTFPQYESNAPGGEPTLVESSSALEHSYLGIASHNIAPFFAPLGWDWKVTAAVIASFPAREVVIAALGTIYAVDADDEQLETSLISRIKRSTHTDGSPVFTLPMAIGLMVFYAFCLQCAATMAVMRRETNTWRWPVFAWFYMTTVGYLGALLCFQFGTALTTIA